MHTSWGQTPGEDPHQVAGSGVHDPPGGSRHAPSESLPSQRIT